MTMFDRIVSVDWSGAGTESKGVDLRVIKFDAETNQISVVNRIHQKKEIRSWSRQYFRTWIVDQLKLNKPTLVALDFGFGLPWGADRALFEQTGWRNMIAEISRAYEDKKTARATAEAINGRLIEAGTGGAYRFNENRNDFRFYLQNQVAYYRLTELIAPQAISQWYLGSGGTVGFHTITGLSMLDYLIKLREKDEIDFEIWPHENLKPTGNKHVLCESYPAICPRLEIYGNCNPNDQNQHDAWRVVKMLVDNLDENIFHIDEQPFGRIDTVSFHDQIRFEGYILGLNGQSKSKIQS